MGSHGGFFGLSGVIVSVPGENKLKKIHDARLIGHQLIGAKERQEPAFIWRFVGDKKILAPVKLEIVKKARNEFVISPVSGHQQVFQEVIGSCEKLNFFLPHSSLLFQADLKQVELGGSLSLGFPAFIAQVERRKWLRMPGEGDERLRLQFCKQVAAPRPLNQFFSKGLYDLSAGGLSFLVTKAESRFFLAGETIKGLELIINNTKYLIQSQILQVQEMAPSGYGAAPYKVWKVSVRFDVIGSREQDELAKFVFENMKIDEKAV